MLQLVKCILLLFSIQCLLMSCTKKQQKINRVKQYAIEVSAEQEDAFDALNEIQVTMPGEHLYSTFPDLYHTCFPEDTTFEISQQEFLIVLDTLLGMYCTEMPKSDCDSLARVSARADTTYQVLHCYSRTKDIFDDGSQKKIKRYSGTWILSKVLDRRDIVINW